MNGKTAFGSFSGGSAVGVATRSRQQADVNPAKYWWKIFMN
jgi:hypothetical protein